MACGDFLCKHGNWLAKCTICNLHHDYYYDPISLAFHIIYESYVYVPDPLKSKDIFEKMYDDAYRKHKN